MPTSWCSGENGCWPGFQPLTPALPLLERLLGFPVPKPVQSLPHTSMAQCLSHGQISALSIFFSSPCSPGQSFPPSHASSHLGTSNKYTSPFTVLVVAQSRDTRAPSPECQPRASWQVSETWSMTWVSLAGVPMRPHLPK